MTANLTLEAEVDQFLSKSSSSISSLSKLNVGNDEDNPPKLPQLKPKSLKYGKESINNNYKIYLLLELVTRRAWNDVIKLSDELLFGKSSIYQPICTNLMNGLSTGSKKDGNDDTSRTTTSEEKIDGLSKAEIQQNVVEIIQWRIRSMFHLRRFNDLKLCIEDMNLSCAKYCNDELPSWIPMSLILQSMECLALLNGIHKKNKQMQRKKGDGVDLDEKEEEKDNDDVLDEFYHLRTKITDPITSKNDKKDTNWRHLLQLDIVLSNVLIKNEEWRLALVTLEQVIGYSEELATSWAKKLLQSRRRVSGGSSVLLRNTAQLVTKAIIIEMLSRQGRVLLQSGALPAAATIFERAHNENQEILSVGIIEKISGDESDVSGISLKDNNVILDQKIIQNIPTQIMINEGEIKYSPSFKKFLHLFFQHSLFLYRATSFCSYGL